MVVKGGWYLQVYFDLVPQIGTVQQQQRHQQARHGCKLSLFEENVYCVLVGFIWYGDLELYCFCQCAKRA